MQIYDSTTDLQKIAKGWVLTIGNFDGVHLGHQQIIAAAKAANQNFAAPGNAKVAVMTFEPHPVAILHPEKAPGVLTPLPLKEHLLTESGVDCLIVLKDTYDLLNLSPKDFIDQFLIKTVHPAVVVEGANFNFGYGRSGDIQTLKNLAAERNFDVIEVPPLKIKLPDDNSELLCSSSLVRHLLEKGRAAAARSALGRPYRLIGPVISGRGVGTKLGFPTANIDPDDQIVPDEGVYAGFVEIADTFERLCTAHQQLPAVFSIGRAKTFISTHPLLTEAHVLDRNIGDLRDKYMAMDFIKKIRPQIRFEDKKQLKLQIEKDCKTTKKILKENYGNRK